MSIEGRYRRIRDGWRLERSFGGERWYFISRCGVECLDFRPREAVFANMGWNAVIQPRQ